MVLKLYGTDVSPPTRATLMMIDILKAEMQFIEVNLPAREHYKPEYLEKNPLHTVPMLEDDDLKIVDSHVILTYLATKFRKDLYPTDINTRCLVDQRLYFDATILFPRLKNVIYDLSYNNTRGLSDAHKNNIEEAYKLTEKYLEETKFIATDEFTVADISCVATISSFNAIIPINKSYVRLHQWWELLKEQAYSFNYSQTHTWMAMDIGFAIVEKPYNFSDLSYRIDCSYVPRSISINFDPTYTEHDEHVLIYGWGHTESMRAPGDTTNYNSLYLQVAPTRMISKKNCTKYFAEEDMKAAIDMYMVCTMGNGNLDAEGEVIDTGSYKYDNGCDRRRNTENNKNCGDHDYDIDDYTDSRRYSPDKVEIFNNTYSNHYIKSRVRMVGARRQGICQNDHGGPLVAWVGSQEVVVGVATSSLHDKYFYCVSPSLFTSTHCSMRFVVCSLHFWETNFALRRKMCEDLRKEEGYDLDEKEVDWSNHNAQNSNNKNNVRSNVNEKTVNSVFNSTKDETRNSLRMATVNDKNDFGKIEDVVII